MHTWRTGLYGLLCSLLLALSACGGGGSPVNTPQQGSLGELNIELERLAATQNSRIIPIRVIFGPTGASDDIPVWIRLGYKLSLNISERVINMSAAPGTPDFNNESLVFLIPPDGRDFLLFWDAARDLGDEANEDTVVVRAGALRTDAEDPEEAICDFQPVVQVILDEGVVCQSVPPQIEGETLSLATPGQTYSEQLEVTGGEDVRFELWDTENNEVADSNTVAPGLTLDEITGAITGTFAGTSPEAIEFVVRVADECTETSNEGSAARDGQQIVGGGLRFDLADFTIPVATTNCPEPAPSINQEPLSVEFGSPFDVQLTATGGTGALTWALGDSEIPEGYVLNSDGRLTGFADQYFNFDFVVEVTDSCVPPRTDTAVLNFNVDCQDVPPSFNFPTVPQGMYGEFFDYTFTVDFPGGFGSIEENDGNLPPGVDFVVTPAGDNLSASVRVSGTILEQDAVRRGAGVTQNDTFEAVFLATDACPGEPLTDTGFLTIEVLPAGGCPPLSLPIQDLPSGEIGTPYEAQVTAIGGVGPFTWTDDDGKSNTLPPGLSIDDNGLISGTPTVDGIFDSIFLTVEDSCSDPAPQSASNDFEIEIIDPEQCPPFSLVRPITPPAATIGEPYSFQMNVSGGVGTISWFTSPDPDNLPAGLTLDQTGLLSGTPTGPAGDFSVRITVEDECFFKKQPQSDQQTITITVNSTGCAPIVAKPPSLPSLVVNGVAEDFQIVASGGEGVLTFAIEANPDSLPPDLVLSTDGRLTGSPDIKPDFFTFDLVITDECVPVPQEYRETITMQVIDPCAPYDITTTDLPDAENGTPYSRSIDAFGVPPFSYILITGALPAGLTLNPDGTITGTPEDKPGSFTFTVRGQDSCQLGPQSDTQELTIILDDPVGCDPLDILTTSLPNAINDLPYSAQLLASGGSGTITWMLNASSSPLPLGLTLDSSGLISGTPDDKPGSYTINVDAMDMCPLGSQIDSQLLTLQLDEINCALLSIDETPVPEIIIGQPYSFQFTATGGEGALTWSLDPTSDPLPDGLTLSATGQLSGFVVEGSVPSEFNLVVRVTDECALGPQIDTFAQLVNVRCVELGPLSGIPPDMFGNENYRFQPILDNPGVPPYNWDIDSGFGTGLPPGISIDTLTGEISGFPDASAGIYTFRVVVSDSCDIQQIVNGDYTLELFDCRPLGPITGQPEVAVNGLPFSFIPGLENPGGPPLNWFINGKVSVPNGLTFSDLDGSFIGTPAEIPGTYTIPLRVGDRCDQFADSELTFRIEANPDCPALAILNTGFPDCTIFNGYFEGLDAIGGSGNYFWRLAPGSGPLPDGLVVEDADGWAIWGTPSNESQIDQTFTFTLQVVDLEGCKWGPIEAQRTYTITVRQNP